MKIIKKALAVLLALILGLSPIIVSADTNVSEFNTILWADVISTPPPSLGDGQVWTGKSLTYHHRGETPIPEARVTVTLYAWGNTFPGEELDDEGILTTVQYMPLDAENPYLVITDNVGEFKLDEATFTFTIGGVEHPVTIGTQTFSNGEFSGDIKIEVSGTYVIWSAHQHLFVGPQPVTLSYEIYLDETVFRTDYIYSSGLASSVKYYPNPLNHNYWDVETTILDAFTAALNWNNGAGMNSGSITDNEFNILINLGANRGTPVGQLSTDPGAVWLGRATVTELGTTNVIGEFDWHLQWYDTMITTPKFHYVTIRDFPEAGLNTRYQIVIPNPGGNISIPGGRTITSTVSVRLEFPPGNPDAPFMWDGNAIVTDLDAIAQIMLQEPPPPNGTVIVQKELATTVPFDLYPDWGVDDDTVFYAVMQDLVSGRYLTFQRDSSPPDSDYNYYNFVGFVELQVNTTRIQFSVNAPAKLSGVHVNAPETADTETARYIVTEVNMPATDLIETTYSFDRSVGFGVENEGTTTATVTNTYSHGIGTLTLVKLLDGFPEDWGVNLDTVFYMRVWDVEAGNWLLFAETRQPDGTFRCVGNHYFGLTEPYTGPVMLEIPVTARTPVVLSNLWSWGSYRVYEMRRHTGDGSISYISGTSDIRAAWNAWWAGIDRDPDMNHRPWLELPPVGIPDVGGATGGFARWEAYWEAVPSMTSSDEDWAAWYLDETLTWAVQYSDDNGEAVLTPFGNIVVNLTNRYKYESGNMFIRKVFDPGSHLLCWGITNDTVFHATVWCDPLQRGEAYRNRLIFQEMRDGTGPPVAYRNIGYIQYDTGAVVFHEERDEDITNWVSTVEFTVNRPAKLTNLPTTNAAEGRFHNYIVEEYFVGYHGHVTTRVMQVTALGEIDMPVYGIPADIGQAINVNIHNFYPHGESIVIVNKILDGAPTDWNIDGDTHFYVQVAGFDTLEQEDLGILEFIDNSDGTFTWNDPNYPPDNPAGAAPITFLPVAQNQPLFLLGLDSYMRLATTDFEEFVEITNPAEFDDADLIENGRRFRRIEEYFPQDFFLHTITDDPNNRAVFEQGHPAMGIDDPGNLVINVTNHWEHGIATLVVHKALVDAPDTITGTTRFPVMIRDVTDNNNLLWIPMWIRDDSYTEDDNVWWCVGNDIASLSEFLTPAEVQSVTPIVPISVDNPATLLNLWTGREYRVYEFNVHYDLRTDYFPPPIAYHYEDFITAVANYGGLIWHGETKHTTVTNTFLPEMAHYTVTYHGNGNDAGTAPVDSTMYHEGDEVQVKDYGDLYKVGYVFWGWSENPDQDPEDEDGMLQPYDPDFPMLGGLFDMPARNVNLYAIWIPGGLVWTDELTVTYYWNYDRDDDGDDSDIYVDQTYDWDHEVNPDGILISPPADPTRPGYIFRGWFWYDEGEPVYEWDFDAPLTMDIDFYAIWEPAAAGQVYPTITKSANRTTAAVGDIINYTITVTNHTGDSLSDFMVEDTINTGLVNFDLANVRINGAPVASPNSATFDSGVLRVILAELPLYSSTRITFPITVLPEATGSTVTNVAVLRGPPDDPGDPGERPTVGDPTDTVEVVIIHTPQAYDAPPAAVEPTPEFAVPFSRRHYQYLIGYDTGEIRPHASITRAEVATIFFRLIIDDFRAEMWMQSNPYSDVELQQWFNNGISTMTNAQIFYGMPDGTFQPDRPITRAEFAAAVTRFLDAGHIEAYYDEPDVFTDIAGHWAQSQINVIGNLGWAIGTGNGEFEPNRDITRAEVATIINRMLRRRLEFVSDTLPGVIIWPDNTNEAAWYFLEIQEATNSNEYEMKADGIHKRWTALTPNREWELLERPDSTPYSIGFW